MSEVREKRMKKKLLLAGSFAALLASSSSVGGTYNRADNERCGTNVARVEQAHDKALRSKVMPISTTLNLGRYVGAVNGRTKMQCGEVRRLRQRYGIDSTMRIIDPPREA
ncbi:MAG: hypothetical protein AAB573_02500 [Patescibacteria group bacterium]